MAGTGVVTSLSSQEKTRLREMSNRGDVHVFLGDPMSDACDKTTVEPGNVFSPGVWTCGVSVVVAADGRAHAPEDVGADEGLGIHDGAVDVRLGGEVDDGVGGVGDGVAHGLSVGDVGADELVSLVGDAIEVLEVAGVGQEVDIDDADVGALVEDDADETGADEAGASRDDPGGHGLLSP